MLFMDLPIFPKLKSRKEQLVNENLIKIANMVNISFTLIFSSDFRYTYIKHLFVKSFAKNFWLKNKHLEKKRFLFCFLTSQNCKCTICESHAWKFLIHLYPKSLYISPWTEGRIEAARARDICLCFGRYDNQGLLPNIMTSYYEPNDVTLLQSYSLAYFFLGGAHTKESYNARISNGLSKVMS